MQHQRFRSSWLHGRRESKRDCLVHWTHKKFLPKVYPRSVFPFLERFINLALPRIRDFRGVNPKSFDGRGNYTLGVKEQLIFPEISFDKIDSIRGMDITIVTSASTDQEGKALLKELGMPFSN